MTVSDYMPLMEKIRNRMCNWNGRFLSYAGRLQLINSVIMSLTNFWLAAFRLPKQCLTEIEKLCAAFLWSGPELSTKKSKVSWYEVCKKKSEGGLGMRPLREVNEVSCLKLVWRIVSGKSLWVQWIKIYLIRKGSFWSLKENSVTGSWMWKKILKTREVAKKFHRMEVRNGEATSFWYDHWCKLGRLIDALGVSGRISLGIAADMTVAEASSIYRRKRHRLDILNRVEDELEKFREENREQEDVALWREKADKFKRSFSSKNTWLEIRENHPNMDWAKGIWFKHATPKFAFHVWIAMKNRLSTCDRMQKWNPSIDTSCIFCQHQMETRDHLFFSCQYSSQIWSKLMRGLLQLQYTEDWDELVNILLDVTRDRTRLFLVRYTFQAAAHAIWRERNRRRHGEIGLPPNLLIKMLDKNVRNRLSTIRRQGDRKHDNGLIIWFGSR